MDLDRLGIGEKIAAGSAVLLFIFMFFDWYSVEVSGGALAATGAGGDAWDALDNIPIFLLITIIVVIGIGVLRLADAPYEPPFPANYATLILGAISVVLILYRIVDTPGGGSVPGFSIDVSPALGIFLSLIAAAGIAYGGYRGLDEEGVALRGS